MDIKLNDKTITLPDGTTLQGALDSQEIKPQGIATALNGTVVPIAQRATTTLNEGDTIIIIKAFYGG